MPDILMQIFFLEHHDEDTSHWYPQYYDAISAKNFKKK